MDWYVCRGCGEADDIARITPTIRPVTSIRIEDGALTADLGETEQDDDSYAASFGSARAVARMDIFARGCPRGGLISVFGYRWLTGSEPEPVTMSSHR